MPDQLTTYQKKKRTELLKAIQGKKPQLAKDKENKLDSFLSENQHLLKEQKENQTGSSNLEIPLAELQQNTITESYEGVKTPANTESVVSKSTPEEVVDYSYVKPTEDIVKPEIKISEKAKEEIAHEQALVSEELSSAIEEAGGDSLKPITEQVLDIVEEREIVSKPKPKLPVHIEKPKISLSNPFKILIQAFINFRDWISEVDETAEIQANSDNEVAALKTEELMQDIKVVASSVSKTSKEEKLNVLSKLSFFVRGMFEVLAYRIFKPVEERDEYKEAFMEEGEIDEVYSLKITRQALVMSGIFIGTLIVFALFERLSAMYLPFTFLRELIFIIPLSIFYLFVYKYHNRIYLNNLYPLSIMIGGVLELAIAGVFIINAYMFSTVLSFLIAAFFIYFGMTRLEFDFKKISRQITLPDRDKECGSCGKIIPKGENYCHACDAHVY